MPWSKTSASPKSRSHDECLSGAARSTTYFSLPGLDWNDSITGASWSAFQESALTERCAGSPERPAAAHSVLIDSFLSMASLKLALASAAEISLMCMWYNSLAEQSSFSPFSTLRAMICLRMFVLTFWYHSFSFDAPSAIQRKNACGIHTMRGPLRWGRVW
jgi:hypothetical protein